MKKQATVNQLLKIRKCSLFLITTLMHIVVYAQPSAPTGISATAGDTKALISFTASSTYGSGATGIAYYTVSIYSGGGSQTATGSTSPIQITGLTNGTAYTFKVTATNNASTPATSAASSASNSVNPSTTIAWTGLASDGLWSSANNWAGGSVPTSTENVTIGNYAVTISSGTAVANIVTLNTAGGSLTNNSTLTINTSTASTASISMTDATFINGSSATLNVTTASSNCVVINGSAGGGKSNTFTANGTLNFVSTTANYYVFSVTGTDPITINGTGFTLGATGAGVATGILTSTAASTITIGASGSINATVITDYFDYTTSTGRGISMTAGKLNNYGNVTYTQSTTSSTVAVYPVYLSSQGSSLPIAFNNYGTFTSVANGSGNPTGIDLLETTTGGTITVTNSGTMSLAVTYGMNVNNGLNASITNSGTMSFATSGGATVYSSMEFNSNSNVNEQFNNSGTLNLAASSKAIWFGTNSTNAPNLANTGTINITAGQIQYSATTGVAGTINNNTGGVINFNYASSTNAFAAYSSGTVVPILYNTGGTIAGYNVTLPASSYFVTNTSPLGTLAPSVNGSGTGTINLPSSYALYGNYSPQIISNTAYGTVGGSSLNMSNAALVITSTYAPAAGTEYYITPSTATGTFSSVSFTTSTGGWGVDYSTASTTGYGVVYYTTPTAPTGVSAIVGNQNATVSFTLPTDLGGGVTSYKVTPYIGATAQATTSGSTSPIVVSGLTNGTAYTFTVTAVNPAGSTASGATSAVTPNPPPSAPTIVSATAGDGNAILFFNAPSSFGSGSSSISTYTVTSSGGTSTLTASGSVNPIQIIGLTNGSAYTFTVTATNNLGVTGPASPASSSVTPTVSGAIDSIFSVSAGATLASSGSGTINSSVLLFGLASPGSTPSTAALNTGAFNFSTLSSYKIDISNVAGTAGSSSGWDLINSSGALAFPSSGIITLDITAPSTGTGFSNTTGYTWTIAKGTSVSGFNASNFTLLTNNFHPTLAGAFSLAQNGNNVNLVYTPNPVVTLSSISSSINPFSSQCVNSASTAYTFTVAGSYLLGNIIITPPTGFQISQASGSGYTTGSISLTPTSGTVNATTIYVEFAPSTATTYSGGNITVTSTSATTQSVPVSGTGNALPTLLTTSSSSIALCGGSAATISVTGLLANSTSSINYTVGGTSDTQTATGVVANSSGNASFSTIALTSANSGQTITINSITRTDIGSCTTTFSSNNTATLPTVTTNVTPSISIAAVPSGIICSGTSVTFTATPTNGGTPTYQWTKGGNNITGATSSTYSYTPANGDVIACVMTANNACQTSSSATSNAITETVNATNTINLTSSAGTNAQTISFNAAIANITYATTSATGASFAGLPSGVSANWVSNVVTISGTPTVTGTFNYTITLTGGCGIVTANGTIIVNTIAPTFGLFTVASQNYGASSFALTAPTSNSSGSFTYTSSNTSVATISGTILTIVGAGTSTITASQAASGNYTTGSTTATLTVNKATLTITAVNQSVTYGTAASTVTSAGSYALTGFVNGDNASVISGFVTYSTTYTATTAAATSGVTITPIISGLYASNYAFSAENGTVTIGKATLNITASNQTVTYGTSVATVTGAGSYTSSGFLNSDNSSVVSGSVTYTTTYTATTAIGASGITITPVVTGLSATNYSFNPASGTISVVPIAPSVPLNVYAYQANATAATVTFSTPLTTNGTITGYTATISTISGTSPSTTQMTLSQANGGSLTFTGLTTGSTYSFTVTCTNGTTSAASASSNSVTLVNLSATDTFKAVTNTDWNTSTNWSSGTIPNAATPVVVAVGKTAIISASETALANNIILANGASLTNNSGGTLTVTTINNTTGVTLTNATFDNEGTLNITTSDGSCISFSGSGNTFTANGTSTLAASYGSDVLYANSSSTTTLAGAGFSIGSSTSGVSYALLYVGSGANFTINASVSLSCYFNYTSLYNTQIYITGVNTVFNNYGNITVSPASTQVAGSYCYALALNSGNNNNITFNNYGTFTTTTGYQGIRLGTTGTITINSTQGTDSLKNYGTLNLNLSGTGTPFNTTYGVNVFIVNAGTMNLGGTNANAMSITTSGTSSAPTNFNATQSLINTGTININSGAIVCNYVPAISGTPFNIANNLNGIINFKYATATTAIYYSAGISKTILTNSGGTVAGYNCTLTTSDSCFISNTGTLSPLPFSGGIGTITLPTNYTLTGTLSPQITSASAFGQLVCPTLDVTNATLQLTPDYTPTNGDALALVKCTSSKTTPFSSTVLPLGWSVSYSNATYIYADYQGPSLGSFAVSTHTYGAAPFTLSAPSSNSAGAFAYSSSNSSVATVSGATITIVGEGSSVITATQAANGSYSSGAITAILNVNKASLTITANNQSVNYGSAVASVTSAGTYTPSGFVNGDNASVISGSVSYSTTYTATTTAGTSGVTITPIVSGLSANNYTFTPANGTITILSLTANITWTGAVSTNWGTAGNWSGGSLPISTNSVTIPSSATNQPVLNANDTVAAITSTGNISLNGYTLTINGAISGAGTVTGSPTSGLSFGGSAAGTLFFDQSTNYSTNSVANFTLNTSGTVVLGNTLNLFATVTPTSGTLSTGGYLTLVSNASGTARIDQVLGTITGNVTVQRYISPKSARKFSFVGSPVAQSIRNSWQQQVYITGSGTGGVPCGSTLGDGGNTDKYNSNGFDVTQTNTPSMFNYNATKVNGSRYVSVPNTDFTNLAPGTGYVMNIRGNRNSGDVSCINQLETGTPTPPEAVTLIAYGTVTSGNLSVTLNNPSVHPYTLIANPYPSQVSFTAFQGSNSSINNKMWTYSPFGNGNYTTFSAGVIANGATGYDNTHGDYIASGQAFFVEANTAGSVTFHENHKSNGTIPNTQYFGSASNKLIRIGLQATTDSSLLDEIVIRFNANGSKTYTPNWDAHSLSAANQTLVVLKQNDRLAIATLPDSTANDTAQVAFTSTSTGKFQLIFSNFNGLDSSQSITLIDNYLNATQNIRTNQLYAFNVTSDTNSQSSSRFQVVFNTVSPLSVTFKGLSATKNKEGVVVKWDVVNEQNAIANYEVQQSNDGTNFSTIATTKAINASSYTVQDNHLPNISGTLFYRIKALENDGSIKYSNTASLQLTIDNYQLTIVPNPVQNKLTVTLWGATNEIYKVRIITIAGVEVVSKTGVSANGNTLALDASSLASGVYMLELTDENGNKQLAKFVKN